MPADSTLGHDTTIERPKPLRDRAMSADELDRVAAYTPPAAHEPVPAPLPTLGEIERLRERLEAIALAIPGRNPLRHVDRPASGTPDSRAANDAVDEARRVIEDARLRLAEIAARSAPPEPLRAARTPRPRAAAQRTTAAPPPATAQPLAAPRPSRVGREYEWELAVRSVFDRSRPAKAPSDELAQPAFRTALADKVQRRGTRNSTAR